MKAHRHRMRHAALALLLAAQATASAWAADAYPSKPIVVKLAFPPGGNADASARAAQPLMTKELGQPVVIENLPGANGSIATMNVLRAEHDGYTLLGTTGIDFIVTPMTVTSAKYQPGKFKMVGVTTISDFGLVSSAEHNFANVDAVVAYATNKANTPLTIAHWGVGSAPHLVTADFERITGSVFTEVPYKGAAPVATDLSGGHVDLAFVPLGGQTFSLIRSGKLKLIAIAAAKRDPNFPDMPTFSENPKFKDFNYALWAALLAPPDTPDAVVEKLAKSLNEWNISAENAERLKGNGSRPWPSQTTAQNAAFLQSEVAKYTKLGQSLNLSPQ